MNTTLQATWSGITLPLVRNRNQWVAEFRDDEYRQILFVVESEQGGNWREYRAYTVTDGCVEPVTHGGMDTPQEAATLLAIEYVNALEALDIFRVDGYEAAVVNATIPSLF